MNILFISHSALATGAERVLIDIINYNKNSTVKKHVIIPKEKKNSFSSLLKAENIKEVHYLLYKNVSTNLIKTIICLIYNISSLIYLLWYCKKEKIDTLYINTSVNLLGLCIALFFKKKIVWHIHEQPNKNTKVIPVQLFSLYRKIISLKNVHIIFTSNRSLIKWEKELSIKILNFSILNPPVRNLQIEKQSESTFNFGYLGTLIETKNIISLIVCFAKLVEERKQKIKLVLSGSGPLLEEIMVICEELNITDDVELFGYTDDVSEFYSKIDVLVQPSYNESWSMVVVEALSLGIPCIVTKESGIADVLLETEFLSIDPCDPDDILLKMKKISEVNYYNTLKEQSYIAYKRLRLNDVFYSSIKEILYG